MYSLGKHLGIPPVMCLQTNQSMVEVFAFFLYWSVIAEEQQTRSGDPGGVASSAEDPTHDVWNVSLNLSPTDQESVIGGKSRYVCVCACVHLCVYVHGN